jgi:hypothetical protein
LDALTKELASPLGLVLKAFPTCRQMHPFEQALLDLTLGIESYQKRLGKLNNLRKTCLEVTPHQVKLKWRLQVGELGRTAPLHCLWKIKPGSVEGGKGVSAFHSDLKKTRSV